MVRPDNEMVPFWQKKGKFYGIYYSDDWNISKKPASRFIFQIIDLKESKLIFEIYYFLGLKDFDNKLVKDAFLFFKSK